MTEQALPPSLPREPDPASFQTRATRAFYQEDPRLRSVVLATLLSLSRAWARSTSATSSRASSMPC